MSGRFLNALKIAVAMVGSFSAVIGGIVVLIALSNTLGAWTLLLTPVVLIAAITVTGMLFEWSTDL